MPHSARFPRWKLGIVSRSTRVEYSDSNPKEKREMEARLKKLERLNKVLFAGLALALLPWIIAAAKTIPDLIEGKSAKFQTVTMVDENGNSVGGLVGKKDDSALTIKDSSGQPRIVLGFWKGHPSLLFADKKGNIVATYAEKDGLFESVE